MFGKKESNKSDPNSWKITESGELKEVEKTEERLDSDEIVHVMAKQSKGQTRSSSNRYTKYSFWNI
jgi:hypothetical protein